jgi:hypothetical protein
LLNSSKLFVSNPEALPIRARHELSIRVGSELTLTMKKGCNVEISAHTN